MNELPSGPGTEHLEYNARIGTTTAISASIVLRVVEVPYTAGS